jgi:CRISPR-associated protein Cmr4
VVTDFYPLLVPVPSLEKGFAYVTFKRLMGYAEALGVQMNNLLQNSNTSLKELTIGIEKFEVNEVRVWNGPQAHPFLNNSAEVYVLDDKFAKPIFNRITVKVTRVRIDRSKKTVATGALWTEEYLPHGTILVGAFVERAWENEACNMAKKKAENKQLIDWKTVLGFNNNSSIELVLGGKETVGKGLVRLTII